MQKRVESEAINKETREINTRSVRRLMQFQVKAMLRDRRKQYPQRTEYLGIIKRKTSDRKQWKDR